MAAPDFWGSGPEPDVRRSKSLVEEELLIKLGAKKEVIEFHPLILSSRPARAKSSINFKYSRVCPPAVERSTVTKSPWYCDVPAMRQISDRTRQGPRDFILPSLPPRSKDVKTVPVPLSDEDYQRRRWVRVNVVVIIVMDTIKRSVFTITMPKNDGEIAMAVLDDITKNENNV
ncbi:uncharacterized protein LOC106012300 [Aplysia californica]|uniref:Uncharacterized protein LOC106012300 n=1 Tax=Aplysia californica TaxID=6500 RepID=A0ABM1A3V1_APLCA|nr:uncharacterized protein LOC106012300 [Aplysia californica]